MQVPILRIFNPYKGSLESHDYFGPENTSETEVQKKTMTADFSSVYRNLDS